LRRLPDNNHVFPGFANILQIIPQLRIYELSSNTYQNAPDYTQHLLMCWALVHRSTYMQSYLHIVWHALDSPGPKLRLRHDNTSGAMLLFETDLLTSLIIVHQLPDDVNPRVISNAWSSYYHHRGEIIRNLAVEVTQANLTRRTNAIVTLGQFLIIEVSIQSGMTLSVVRNTGD
jgi:hypothetical protein